MSKKKVMYYERFPLARRIEHIVMMLSFSILALTGLPQRFPEADISAFIAGLFGGIEGLRNVHHVSAVVMMLGTIWHLLVFAYKAYVLRESMSMLPRLQDAKDGLQAFLYNIGLKKEYPQMGRFTFEEKMEYWAFVWGAIIMGLTGFMLWNPIITTTFLPGEIIPAAKAAHGLEAILAVLAIIIWHFYGVHIRHFNKSMFTGKMSETEMLHEHPLELADIKAGKTVKRPEPVVIKKREKIFYPIAAVLTVLLLYGVYWFVTVEQTAIATVLPGEEAAVFVPLPTPGVPLVWDGAIEPIFNAKCASCHGAAGGMSFETYADTMKGGKSGPAIVSGDSTAGTVIAIHITGTHPGLFSPEELALVKQWIDAGAPEK